jgi:tetratricopeptide (TPR) repeat protein
LLLDTATKRMRAFQEQGRYQEALDISLHITQTHPYLAIAWADTAINCARLERWQDAIDYGQIALSHGEKTNNALHDALAYTYSMLGQWDAVRSHGLQALDIRVRYFSGDPVIPLPEPGPLPPPPSAQTREHNVIAFSLFGRDSKYCETAVLNVQEQPQVYPHWVCRFYVDGTVPESVIARLRAGGGQIVQVQEPAVAQWPGPMWRLLALQDPQAHRILFRDADSVISRREAAAVEQWVASGKRFHMMRDAASHTELILAGMWGVIAGSLPPLQQLMERLMSAPLKSRRFADQTFLRQYVWPYARASLMQHDSVFGFMDAAPFPDGQRPEGFHVGCMESLVYTTKTDLPDGSQADWELYRIEKPDNGPAQEKLVCSYANTVRNGAVSVHVPVRYAQWIQQGTARLELAGTAARQAAPVAPSPPLQATQASTPAQEPSQEQLWVDAAVQRMRALQAQERYQDALDICLQIARAHPKMPGGWSSAAINCAGLQRWQDTVRYGQTALGYGANTVELYDALAHASYQLGQLNEARRHGLRALGMRERQFSGEPVMALAPGPLPPPPSAQTRERNVIAFSLFGGDSKYCEPAVLNVQEQPQVYPNWVCRFYVDGSVPEHVIARLRAGGGQIVPVTSAQAQWPGPMWRFLALDDPQAHRILLRDADSVISQREAAAVEQWVASGKRFHMMRDDGSHTELILAGLWGVVAGCLPPVEKLMERFMSAPLESGHFADQYFLQQYVWPYARASLMQHDSVFGFMDAEPFPQGEKRDGFTVGNSEGSAFLTTKINLPDGAEVVWNLRLIDKLDNGQVREQPVCSYPATVRDGIVRMYIPARYMRRLEQGTAGVRLSGKSAA